MTADAVTAVDLARRVKVDPKRFRSWLREQARAGHPLLRAHQHRDAWVFTREEADALVEHFNSKALRSGVSSGAASRLVAAALAAPQAGGAAAAAIYSRTPVPPPSSTEVIEALTTTPPRPTSGLVKDDLPAASGLYAWWLPHGVLPALQRDDAEARSVDKDLLLLYVGISSDLRQRLWQNHINGNTRGSTLRRTLASLVGPGDLGTPGAATPEILLWTAESEVALTQWIKAHLSLTWAVHPMPKAVEADVIARMKPPCNLDHNSSHPNYASLFAARTTWRSGQSS